VDGGASTEAIELAIAKGSSIDARGTKATTALEAALRSGNFPAVTLLASAGADLYARDADGETPASLALAGPPEALAALLALPAASALPSLVSLMDRIKGADPLGNGLLAYAALAGNEAAVDKLLAMGADRAQRNILGENAADIAKKRGFIALATKLR
jgi:ankyrin repeat protein